MPFIPLNDLMWAAFMVARGQKCWGRSTAATGDAYFVLSKREDWTTEHQAKCSTVLFSY